jgi:hypothetical protein
MGSFLPADATFKRLTWKDFKTRTMPAPPAGSTAEGAHTITNVVISAGRFHFDRATFLKPPNFKMREDPDVTVTLNAGQMWVASWVFSRPQIFQDNLLDHEQGHYEISMLNAGDIFTELQNINGGAFDSVKEGQAAVDKMFKQLWHTKPIHDKYDLDTGGGLNRTMQMSWNTALSSARVTFQHPSLRTALSNAGLFT